MIIALTVLLGISILANAALAILLTVFHQKEKKDLHDRLMARSPDEYIYNTEVAPAEAKSLRDEFLADKMEKTQLSPEDRKRTEMGRSF